MKVSETLMRGKITFWLVCLVLWLNEASESCYQLSMQPDKYTNDLSWYMYQNFKNGSQVLIDSGGGNQNSAVWKSKCEYADSDECFAFTVVDSYGDGYCCSLANGAGYVNISYGNGTQKIDGRVYSDAYLDNGVGGVSANETYIFENGEWIQYCRFGDPTPAQGCSIDSPAIDIVFVFDSSFSMNSDFWREKLFARYILSDNVPTDTRVAAVTYGTSIVRNFNLTQNSESVRQAIDELDAIHGQQMTTDALEDAIDILIDQSSDSREKFIILFTDDNTNDDEYSCDLESYLDDYGIELILIAETTSTTFEATCLLSNVNDYLIFMESFDDLLDYTGDVESLVCVSENDVRVTEVFIDETEGEAWIEIYNYGQNIPISNFTFNGLIYSNDLSSNTNVFLQGEFYVFGNVNPCQSENYTCNYVATGIKSQAVDDFFVNVYVTGTQIDYVDYNNQGFESISEGFSYELENKYYSNSVGTNWRESCVRGGSPGVDNELECPTVCDGQKCQESGDSGATCGGETSGTYYGIVCTCSSSYYYDSDARTCEAVESINSCEVTVYSTDSIIEFDTVSQDYVTGYTISIEGYATEFTATESPYSFDIDYTNILSSVVTVSVNALINNKTKESGAVECTIIDNVGLTRSPSLSPSKSPTTTGTPTLSPTPAPTFGGCSQAKKLDVMILLDSSGSVYDSGFSNWQNELDFVKNVIENALTGDTRVGLVRFSGCRSTWSYSRCLGYRLVKDFGLETFGTNLTGAYNFVDAMNSDDFLYGNTWTDDAMYLAYNEFVNHSSSDREKMMIILTDGQPTSGHEPCLTDNTTGLVSYESDTFIAIQDMGVTMIGVLVDASNSISNEFFTCLLEDDSHFFEVSDFDQLQNSSIIESISSIVCSDDIELIINEVKIDRDLRFIEIFNNNFGVSLLGFRMEGLFTGTFSTSGGIDQNQYWVIADRDPSNITLCNCSADYIVPDGWYVNTSMTRTNWWVTLYDASGTLLDEVYYDSIYFPNVDEGYTYELIDEYKTDDNSGGGSWEESCYKYGTPQRSNEDNCPCSFDKCQEKGDSTAYCDADGNECVCADSYIAIGGVCVPAYPPQCCYAWWIDEANGDIRIQWCAAATSILEGYLITYGSVEKIHTSSYLFYEINVGSSRPNISVQTISQFSPLITSESVDCPYSNPTPSPTDEPTRHPTPPTISPTDVPSSIPSARPSYFPSYIPTESPVTPRCRNVIVSVINDTSNIYDEIKGTYTRDSNASSLTKWSFTHDTLTSMYYDESKESWIIESGSYYFMYSAVNSSEKYPPLYENAWYCVSCDENVKLYIDCSHTYLPTNAPSSPTDIPTQAPTGTLQPTSTRYPTSQPSVEPTNAPTEECLYLSINSSLVLYKDEFTNDGKTQWSDDTGTYKIVWYQFLLRWTYDNSINFYVAQSENDGTYPVLDVLTSWSIIGDSSNGLALLLECKTANELNITTSAPVATTPAPTESDIAACTFPNGIIFNWEVYQLRNWERCYYETYSSGTTSDELISKCGPTGDNTWWFVGAMNVTESTDRLYMGSYVNASNVANNFIGTSSRTGYSINGVHWYHVQDKAFGFADSTSIDLDSCDVSQPDSKKRLCWHLLGNEIGGYRAGVHLDLNNDNDFVKVIYKYTCDTTKTEQTPAPTAAYCDQIEVNSSEINTILYDNAEIENDKGAWESKSGKYEFGWYESISSWILFDSSLNDYWTLEDSDAATVPEFDVYQTWYELFDNTETLDIIMQCVANDTLSPPSGNNPPFPDCDYVCVSGLAGIEGCYELQMDYYDGYPYYVSDDGYFIHYLAFMSKWAIDGNGASFLQLNQSMLVNDTIPDSGKYVDYVYGGTIELTFECSNTSAPTSSPTIYGNGEFMFQTVQGELRYTTDTRVGYAIDSSISYNNGTVSRNYSEFFNQKISSISQIGMYISDVYINGSKEYSDGDLTGVYLSRDLRQPENITMILVNDDEDDNIYPQVRNIRVWFQITDKNGITWIDSNGVNVTIVIECLTCNGTSNETRARSECDVSSLSETTGLPHVPCTIEIPNDEVWSSQDKAQSILVYLILDLYDDFVAYSNMETVILVQETTLESPDSLANTGGLYSLFVTYPVRTQETFNASLYLDTNGEIIDVFSLSGEFDETKIEFVSFMGNDELWQSNVFYSETEMNTDGVFGASFERLNEYANTSGVQVYIGYITFNVLDSGFYGQDSNVFSISVTGYNDENSLIFNDKDGIIYDIRNDLDTAGAIEIVDDVNGRGLFVSVETIDVVNTAYLSGTTVKRDAYLYVYYYDYIDTVASRTCSSVSNTILNTRSPTKGCGIEVTSSKTEGGIYSQSMTGRDVNGNSFIKTFNWRVWFPSVDSYEIRGESNVSVIHRIDTPWAPVGDIIYQSVAFSIYATFECESLVTEKVIINPYISVLYSNDSSTLVLYNFDDSPRYLMQGNETFNDENGKYVNLVLKNYNDNTFLFIHSVLVIGDLDSSVGVSIIGGAVITHASYMNDSISIENEKDIIQISGNMEQSFTAPYQCGAVLIWAQLDDGSFMDLSDSNNLEFTVLDSFVTDLEISEIDKSSFDESGDKPPAYACTIETSVTRDWNEMIQVDWYNEEGDRLRGSGYLWVKIDIAEPISVTIDTDCESRILAKESDPAYDIWGYPYYCDISVIVNYDDGTSVDYSDNNSTMFSIIESNIPQLLDFDDNIPYRVIVNESLPLSSFGNESVLISVNGLPFEFNATIDFQVISFDSIFIEASVYPDNGQSVTDLTLINKLGCTDEYEAIKIDVYGQLTDGSIKDFTNRSDVWIEASNYSVIRIVEDSESGQDRIVIGNMNGNSDIYGNFRDSYYSDSLSLTIENTINELDTIDMFTFESGLWEDVVGATMNIMINITFADGTLIVDAVSWFKSDENVWNLTIDDFVLFESSDSNVIDVDSGVMTLLDNWWQEVNISGFVDFDCNNTLVTLGIESIYVNIYPEPWDVDVEIDNTPTGMQFENIVSSNETFSTLNATFVDTSEGSNYTFYINSIDGHLLSFDLKFWFDDSLMKIIKCWPYGDWKDLYFAWNSDTKYGELHIAGAGGGYDTGKDLLAVSQCNIIGRNDSGISRFEGQIIEISYYDDNGDVMHVMNEEMTAAHGYQQINEGETINSLPNDILIRQSSVINNEYSDCGDYLFSDDNDPDCCDMRLPGDVNGDCKVSAFDAHAILYYMTNGYVDLDIVLSLDELLTYQRQGMDLTLNYLTDTESCVVASFDSPCPTNEFDITYLLRMIVSKYLALNITSFDNLVTQTNNNFVVTGIAPFLITNDTNVFNIATDEDAKVYFEINTTLNTEFINYLTIGHYITTTSVDTVIIEAEFDEDYQAFVFQSIYNFTQECISVALIYYTLNEVGNSLNPDLITTANDRYYAYYGSNFIDESDSNDGIFIPMGEECLVNSGATLPPTMAPSQTPRPTNSPTNAPTNEDSGPNLIDCRFEDHGTAIVMSFDSATNRAEQGSSSFSCLIVLTPPSFAAIDGSGHDSRCIWVNSTSLRVEMGYDFDVRVDDYLELTGTNVRGIDGITPAASGVCQVSPAWNPPSYPVVRVIGSTSIGHCQDLYLSAQTSMGLSPPIKYEWTITPDIDDSDGYSFSKSDSTLQIDSEYLTSDYYIVTVKVSIGRGYDSQYRSNSTQVYIDVANNVTGRPYVAFTTPIFMNLNSKRDLSVNLDVASDYCHDDNDDDNDRFTYEWKQETNPSLVSSISVTNPFGFTKPSISSIDITNDLELDKKAFYVPYSYFTVDTFYLFSVTVFDDKYDETNIGYMGIYVNKTVPWKKATQFVEKSRLNNFTLSVYDLFDFSQSAVGNWRYDWECTAPNVNELTNADDCFEILSPSETTHEITINTDTFDGFGDGYYNISVSVIDKAGSTRVYVSNHIYFNYKNESDFITMTFDTNIGAINTNKRLLISSESIDYSKNEVNGINEVGYVFDWIDEFDNIDFDAWGVSVVDQYVVIDGELDQFIYDGQEYKYSLTVTKANIMTENGTNNETYELTNVTGYGYIEMWGNRGPNGGVCEIETIDSSGFEYEIACYGWTDEWYDLPIEYNFMILDYCESDDDCSGELICSNEDVYGGPIEYDLSYCRIESGPHTQTYLTDWSQGNKHSFSLFNNNNSNSLTDGVKTVRASIRDNRGFITNYYLSLTIEDTISKDGDFGDEMESLENDCQIAANNNDLNSMFSNIVTMDVATSSIANGSAIDDDWRSPFVTQFSSLFDNIYNCCLTDTSRLLLLTQCMNELYFESSQFTDEEDGYISETTHDILLTMLDKYNDLTSYDQLPRDLGVSSVMAAAWAGDATLNDDELSENKLEELQDVYVSLISSIVEYSLSNRIVDETALNFSIYDVTVLASYESRSLFGTSKSTCGGEYISLPQAYTNLFEDSEWNYLLCVLIIYNGSLTNAASMNLQSPWINFNIIAYYDTNGTSDDVTNFYDGSVTRRRTQGAEYGMKSKRKSERRLQESQGSFNACDPFIYIESNNPGNSFNDFDTRLDMTAYTTNLAWARCVTRVGNDTMPSEAQGCYVLSHDSDQTLCACNTTYDNIAIQEFTYVPNFYGIKHRTNDELSWDGYMTDICAAFCALLLCFVFANCCLCIPEKERHKAMLAVRKGIPRSQRMKTYFETMEGQLYRHMVLNEEKLSIFGKWWNVYKIRLRNDHICLWLWKSDPGSNISHFFKVCLLLCVVITWMSLLVLFYTFGTINGTTSDEDLLASFDTEFADTIFAFIIAWLGLGPIWCMAWCVSMVRPQKYSDEEIEKFINDEMPFETQDDNWENEYSSADEWDNNGDGSYSYDSQEESDSDDVMDDQISGMAMEKNEKSVNGLKRIYTDIDEEVEFLEDNYMPEEHLWNDSTSVKYRFNKMNDDYYKHNRRNDKKNGKKRWIDLMQNGNDNDDSDNVSNASSSVDSIKPRKGFGYLDYNSHKAMAENGERFGFVVMNNAEEFDVDIATEVQGTYVFEEKHTTIIKTTEITTTSKNGALPNDDAAATPSLGNKFSNKIGSLFAIGSNKNNNKTKKITNYSRQVIELTSDDYDNVPDLSNVEITTNETRSTKSTTKTTTSKGKKPTIASMNAPMQNDQGMVLRVRQEKRGKSKQSENDSKNENSNKKSESQNENENEMISSLPTFYYDQKEHGNLSIEANLVEQNKLLIDVDLDKNKNDSKNDKNSMKSKEDLSLEGGEFLAVHMNASRHRNRFVKILEIGREHRKEIKNDQIVFKNVIDAHIDNGDKDLVYSHKLGRRATKLIKENHPLFGVDSENENENDSDDMKDDEKAVELIGNENDNDKNNDRNVHVLSHITKFPELGPNVREYNEMKTSLDNVYWNESNRAYDSYVMRFENKTNLDRSMLAHVDLDNEEFGFEYNSKPMLNLQDIWDITGDLPPELLKSLEEPYDAWKEEMDDFVPPQRPMAEEDEFDYIHRLRYHFHQRQEMMNMKYPLPHECKWLLWLLLLAIVAIFTIIYFHEGVKIGGVFTYEYSYNITDCRASISETYIFDREYSVVESERRSPAPSPQEAEYGMPNSWDYRTRYVISCCITFFTSFFIAQPVLIGLFAVIFVCCFDVWINIYRCLLCILCCRNPNASQFQAFIGSELLKNSQLNDEKNNNGKNVSSKDGIGIDKNNSKNNDVSAETDMTGDYSSVYTEDQSSVGRDTSPRVGRKQNNTNQGNRQPLLTTQGDEYKTAHV